MTLKTDDIQSLNLREFRKDAIYVSSFSCNIISKISRFLYSLISFPGENIKKTNTTRRYPPIYLIFFGERFWELYAVYLRNDRII